MTTEHVQEDALNMHFDGELAPDEASAVQSHITGCSECTQRLSSLARLREMISMSAMQASSAVDFDAAFGAIEKATRAQPSASWSERAVVWVRETLDHRPARLWVPVAGTALAAAAAALIAIRGVSTDPGVDTAKRSPPRDDRAAKPEPMMLAQPAHEPVPEEPAEGSAASEIVQVDFGSNTGTVFEIALADGASTPVVWINDEE